MDIQTQISNAVGRRPAVPIPRLWPKDEEPYEWDGFDPFSRDIPGNTITDRLRHLFLNKVIRKSDGSFRDPRGLNFEQRALASLYAAMVGFDKEKVSLLYPDGKIPFRAADMRLTFAQHVDREKKPRNRCCGHVFEKGETYYRCKQCCTDPTVVICSACFNTQDHSTHSISVLIGNGSGGCCDCGDPEAFNPIAPRCAIHVPVPEEQSTPVPDDVKSSIAETIATAIDFVIDVFSTMPLTHSEATERECYETANWAELNYEGHQLKDDPKRGLGDWILTLYNDEKHSYADVTGKLEDMDPRRYNDDSAYAVAQQINSEGREAIMKGPKLQNVIVEGLRIMRIGLFCSVRTERDYLKEHLAGIILRWLKDCISVGVAVGGDEMILREIMCQVLSKPWNMGISHPDPRVELDGSPDISNSSWRVESPQSDKIEERWKEKEYIRLDWILFFDARLWKTLRKDVKSIILGCLLGGNAGIAGSSLDRWGPRNWKRITGIRFARDFAQLCHLWLKFDREPHLSITKLGVQIFTTPSISLELVENYHFLTHLLAIEFTYFTREGQIGRPWNVDPAARFVGAQDIPEENAWKPDVKIIEVQEDLHHLLGNESVRRMIPKHRNWLMQFIMFFKLFQELHAQKRETADHREYENQSYETAQVIAQPITRLMAYLADGYATATKEELQWAFGYTLGETYTANTHRFEPASPVLLHEALGTQMVKFKVAEEPVSFWHPLNWMLSLLVGAIVKFDGDSLTDWSVWFPSVPVRDICVITMVDYPLRANVFASQIRAKLWARNGAGMFRQWYFYKYNSAYSRSCSDFTFIQWAFALEPPTAMLAAMLDRYDLTEQLTKPSTYRSAIYPGAGNVLSHHIYMDESLTLMIDEFFQLFLQLMNERSAALGEPAEDLVKREIAHRLIFQKLPYSDISRNVRQHAEVDVDPFFDQSLSEMANFIPPTETQPGLFQLKPEYVSLVDPHYRLYTRNQSLECERLLLEMMASKGVREADRIIEPQERVLRRLNGPFAGLTKVLGSNLFSTVVHCGLLFAMLENSETIIDQALYLCFIAVMDPDTQQSFVTNAQKTPEGSQLSIMDVLSTLLAHTTFSALHSKTRRLLAKIKSVDPTCLERFPEAQQALSTIDDSAAAAEAEKKKSLAKKRGLNALKKMQEEQAKFKAAHQSLFKDTDGGESEDFEEIDKMEIYDESFSLQKFHYPTGACIVCQEVIKPDQAFGACAMIHRHLLNRNLPLHEPESYFIHEVGMTPDSLDISQERPRGQANLFKDRKVLDSENQVRSIQEKALGIGFPYMSTRFSLAVTTCGHLLHHRCWKSYMNSRESRINQHGAPPDHTASGEFLCPLCKSLSNVVIPIVWREGILRPVIIPAWSNLSLDRSHQWLDQLVESIRECGNERSWWNLASRLDTGSRMNAFDSSPSAFRRSLPHSLGSYITMYNKINDILEEHSDVKLRDLMMDGFSILLAGTISAMEVGLRGSGNGVGSELRPPIIGGLSEQNIMLLRILSESCRTSFRHLPPHSGERWEAAFHIFRERVYRIIPEQNIETLPSLLMEGDLFQHFVVSCGVTALAFDLQVGQLLFIHYVAEVVKICLSLTRSVNFLECVANETDAPRLDVPPLVLFLWNETSMHAPPDRLMALVLNFMDRLILPFLRRATIFVHVFEGIIFVDNDEDLSQPEAIRLCRVLGLPTPIEILSMGENSNLFALVKSWVAPLRSEKPDHRLEVQHPAIFEVIGLPHRLDALIEMVSKYVCPGCGTVPDDPAMCLLCGQILCVQSVCCTPENSSRGEVNIHLATYLLRRP